MDWRKLIPKKLVEIKNNINMNQAGLVNVTVNNYNFNFKDVPAKEMEVIAGTLVTPELDKLYHDKAVKRVGEIEGALGLLDKKIAEEFVSAVSSSTAIEVLQMKNLDEQEE